jgi:uncharacterized protein
MTIDPEFPDLCNQVIDLHKKGFQSIHWQIDAGFYKFDFEKKKMERFFKEYNYQVKNLINYWITKIEKGKVLRFYPFLGIVESILNKESTKLRCGAGHEGYAITLDGKIVACPIMNYIEDFKAGTLDSRPKDLKKFSCDEECSKCKYYSLCGGRCLYWRKADLWPKEGNEMICDSVKFLIDEIGEQLPRIEEALRSRKISQEDFKYEKYFGPEIIP